MKTSSGAPRQVFRGGGKLISNVTLGYDKKSSGKLGTLAIGHLEMSQPMGNAERAWPSWHGHLEMHQPIGNASAFLDGHAMMSRPRPPVTLV